MWTRQTQSMYIITKGVILNNSPMAVWQMQHSYLIFSFFCILQRSAKENIPIISCYRFSGKHLQQTSGHLKINSGRHFHSSLMLPPSQSLFHPLLQWDGNHLLVRSSSLITILISLHLISLTQTMGFLWAIPCSRC